MTGQVGDPLNLWRIVHLTDGPDPSSAAAFDGLAGDPCLRVFVEVRLREDLGRGLVRR
ncbi:hypothetical protein AB0G15_42185 [Streptosporangium sp. NPDC023825]|uniref:hypothetical protein n=1 Tax=Streptosporangium sp. NPDC023825 TaxID=3154909 RepID=UPI00343F3122